MPHLVPAPAFRNTPRGYQKIAEQRSLEDLAQHNACLVVVPTGGGKTEILSNTLRAEASSTDGFRAMVLQHTGEILDKNLSVLGGSLSDLGLTVSIVKADRNDWAGDLIFASTPTVSREDRIQDLPFLTHLAVDEAHRIGTESVQAIITAAREINPDLRIMAYTATPNRPDGFSLLSLLTSVSYQITYAELIDQGVIVPPSTKTISLGEEVEAGLAAAPDVSDEFEQRTIGTLLNRPIHNDAVVEHWFEHAAERQTLAFCTTVEHATDLAAAFRRHGVVAEAIWGTMDPDIRREMLERFEDGTIQVLCNCMILTEGYDNPRISCVIGLRRFQEELTFLQAIGRGLRSLDPAKHPGEIKEDCVFLDFTGAAQRHRTLEVRIQEEREAAVRANNPAHVQPSESARDMRPRLRPLRHFGMRDIDLVAEPRQELVLIPAMEGAVARNRNAWAGIFWHHGSWHAVARVGESEPFRLVSGERPSCVAAVDVFLANEPSGRIPRDERDLRPDEETRRMLRRFLIEEPEAATTRYRALCHLAAALARPRIARLLSAYEPMRCKAA